MELFGSHQFLFNLIYFSFLLWGFKFLGKCYQKFFRTSESASVCKIIRKNLT